MFSNKSPKCSFCGKKKEQAALLISGETGFICEECVDRSYEIVRNELNPAAQAESSASLEGLEFELPGFIREVDRHFVGQEKVKTSLGFTILNHFRRIKSEDPSGFNLLKNNTLLIGEPGMGKTHLMRTFSELVDLPMIIISATSYSQSGYVGEDVDSILTALYKKANQDLHLAQKGIVYIENLDKISIKAVRNPSLTRDVHGEGLQVELIELLDDTIINMAPEGGRKHPHQPFIQFDTSNLLFIAGGAFQGLAGIGSSGEVISQNDIVEYGFLPELVNKFSTVLRFEPYSKEEYVQILRGTENSILKQFERFYSGYGIELVFGDGFVEKLAETAVADGGGFSAMKSAIECFLTPRLRESVLNGETGRIEISGEVLD